MSDAGLVLDGHDAEAAHELLLDVVPLVIQGSTTQREQGRCHVDHSAIGEALNKRLVAAQAPSWRAHEIATQPSGDVYWPDCPPDGRSIAATTAPDQEEKAFGTTRRQIDRYMGFFNEVSPGMSAVEKVAQAVLAILPTSRKYS